MGGRTRRACPTDQRFLSERGAGADRLPRPMARVILGSYLFRYPLGGNISCVLQYLLSLEDLGHEVFFVEKSGYENSCWDPVRRVMTDDPTAGIRIVSRELERVGSDCSWCYVDAAGTYYGMSRAAMEEAFRTS